MNFEFYLEHLSAQEIEDHKIGENEYDEQYLNMLRDERIKEIEQQKADEAQAAQAKTAQDQENAQKAKKADQEADANEFGQKVDPATHNQEGLSDEDLKARIEANSKQEKKVDEVVNKPPAWWSEKKFEGETPRAKEKRQATYVEKYAKYAYQYPDVILAIIKFLAPKIHGSKVDREKLKTLDFEAFEKDLEKEFGSEFKGIKIVFGGRHDLVHLALNVVRQYGYILEYIELENSLLWLGIMTVFCMGKSLLFNIPFVGDNKQQTTTTQTANVKTETPENQINEINDLRVKLESYDAKFDSITKTLKYYEDRDQKQRELIRIYESKIAENEKIITPETETGKEKELNKTKKGSNGSGEHTYEKQLEKAKESLSKLEDSLNHLSELSTKGFNTAAKKKRAQRIIEVKGKITKKNTEIENLIKKIEQKNSK